MTAPTGVEIHHLDASYRDTPVLRGVDFTVAAGELACILGPSGCGKTTLLRVVAGFHHADRGTVTIGGRLVEGDYVSVAPEHRRIGYVPQEGALFPHLTVAANVGFGMPRHKPALRRHRKARVEELLELVGLADLAHRHPHQLSGGQQQRIALARALAPRPDLVVLDEPFAALDAGLRQRLRLDIRAALTAAGVTALLVTHDQTEALSLGDQVVLMREGRVLQADRPAELYNRPVDAWAAHFVGDATILACKLAGASAHTSLGLMPVIPDPSRADSEACVVIRPDQVSLHDPSPSTPTWRTGTVIRSEYYGHDALIQIMVSNDNTITMLARVRGADSPPVGQLVAFDIHGILATCDPGVSAQHSPTYPDTEP